jgi:serine/threonine-protein kinase
VVHRDLKPSNIFLARTGGDAPTVKVIDFGIARETGSAAALRITSADQAIGSPYYMSPEQMMGLADLDARSDVWSMGASLYELIAGHVPFSGETFFEIFAAAHKRPLVPLRAHIADVPPAVQSVLSTCLHKDRDQRFPSMRALATALRAILSA